MEKTIKTQRMISLDIIRIFAFFSVCGVHFFLNTGYYQETLDGQKLYWMTVIRNFFMICVPLFIILTGYLKSKKELSKKYYLGIIRIIIIYLIASVICLLFKKYHLKYTDIDWKNGIKQILNFSAAPYAWYIEMYIGLFMLIPFLNLIFNNLKDQKQAKWLIITMLFLTSFPAILNIYELNLEWWKQPSMGNNYIKIIPNWWTSIYPITYYFIGCYLKKYGSKMGAIKNTIFLVISILLVGSFNYYRSYGKNLRWGVWNDWGSILNVILVYLIFTLLLRIKTKREHKILEIALKELSNATLFGYLISWVFDTIFYQKIIPKEILVQDKLVYFPLVVLSVFLSSILAGVVINKVYELVAWSFKKIQNKVIKKEER